LEIIVLTLHKYVEFIKKIEALGLPVVYQQGSFLASKTFGGNPGTEDSGVFDLFLLAKSSQLILPYSSSFGQMASGLGDVPVLSVWQESKDPAKRREGSRFTTSLYREPCFFHGARYLQELAPSRRAQFEALAPLWMELSQCHFYV
jgi:hypothetical protein